MNEARALQFVAKNTSIPVLHIFAVYTHGPFEDRDEEWSSKYDTYIFMKFVDGETADKEWERLDHISKDCVMGELQGYLEQLRNIPSAGYIESLENGPSIDSMFEYLPNKGPFSSEADFNANLVKAYCSSYKGDVGPFMTGMLAAHKHEIVFTHADCRPANIIIKDGHVAGIVD